MSSSLIHSLDGSENYRCGWVVTLVAGFVQGTGISRTASLSPKWFAAVFASATVRQSVCLTLRCYTGRGEPLLPL
jgi:hypothetical protein